jgi:hypothetical protein
MLTGRSFHCDPEAVRGVEGDSPWLIEAKNLGFTTFVCIDVTHGLARTAYPIGTLVREGR